MTDPKDRKPDTEDPSAEASDERVDDGPAEDDHDHAAVPARHATGPRSDDAEEDAAAEEAARDTFPASDPPAW